MKDRTIVATALLVLVASAAGAAETVAGVAGKARAQAKQWKGDAVLVEIHASPQPDGTLGPGHGAMFTFLSPSTHAALAVAVADGKLMSMPMPSAQSTLPIPDRFVDLTQAVAAAQKQGFGSVRQATLKVFPTEAGNRIAWDLGALPTRGGGSERVYVDATSGTVTTFNELSGRALTEQRAESLREEKIPVDAPIDFATLRHKADAVAASQSPNFKLYQIEVSFRSATLRIEQADFRYFRPAPPRGGPAAGWEQLIVHVSTPRTVGGSRKYVNPGRIMGERSEFSDPRPEPAPANTVSPDEAVRRFTSAPIASPTGSGRVNTRYVDTWTLRVQLIKVGATYSAGLPPLNPSWRLGNGSFGHDPFFKETAPKGRWVWWTITQHADVAGEQIEYTYFDATSGQATSYCGEPQVDQLVRVPCTPPAARHSVGTR